MKNSLCFTLIFSLYIIAFFFFPMHADAALDSRRVEQEKYFQNRTRAALVLVSFEEFVEDLDPKSILYPRIKWNWPREEDVQFRAVKIRPYLQYLEVKKKDDIFNEDIRNTGMVGWILHEIGKETHEVYSPSSIWRREGKPVYTSYKIVVIPNRELQEVFYGFSQVNEKDGRLSQFVPKKLQGTYYPAGRPIDLFKQKSDLGETGFYFLEVGATFRGGGSTTLEIWFYHINSN